MSQVDDLLSLSDCLGLWKSAMPSFIQADFLTLYINIPYCIEHCSFCLYYRKQYSGKIDLDQYLDGLEMEARFYRNKVGKLPISALYIGGGTPSLLSVKQIGRLFKIIEQNFELQHGDENFRCFEVHPAYFTEKKIDAVLSDGFVNRISFGVQSTDPTIIEASRRNWTPLDKIREMVNRIHCYARNKKINTNADLMIGLEKEKYESFERSFFELANLEISRIAVYSNRNSERAGGAEFRNRSVEWINTLNSEVMQRRARYALLNGDLNKYSEAVAWGYSNNLEDCYFSKAYNSSPVDYNNNIGLGYGASSHIISSNIIYWNVGDDKYKMLPQNIIEKKMNNAHRIRRSNTIRLNTFNF